MMVLFNEQEEHLHEIRKKASEHDPLPGAADLSAARASASSNESGTCGPNLTWTFYASTGELVISGYGEMDDFGLTGPWWILES